MKVTICVLALVAAAMAADSTKELLKKGNDQFTSRMFKEVVSAHPGESVVLSAFSVLFPLAQLGLASVGESHDEILQSIGMPNDNATIAVFSEVNKDVRSVKGVELKMASRIYVGEGLELNDAFGAVSRDAFGSDVKNVDFVDKEASAATINAWVEDNTNHRIKDLVKPEALGPGTVSVLVNAIYFKGSWKEKFDKDSTTDRDFHVSKDKTIKVPTMFKNGNFKYGYSKELGAKLLELFYEGEESSCLFVLPDEVDGLGAMLQKMSDPAVLAQATERMHTTEVDVFLPKFKIETTTDLKDVLQKMGVTKMFDSSKARLDNLLKNLGNLYVSSAVQKAFIEVNEEGAEAAAANDFGTAYLSAIVSETAEFLADHPYAYFLKYGTTIIFAGVYQS